ncbi:MAG: nucleotidyltransferase domain-containing protein [Leptospiraceae bacterium]|jgi:predicted nucleotidyltransferase|nr:nucleotidyltransferase domain-containing protein [Leptospiraceae bacterium]MBK9502433.1 nucleotidyltransferase domain-containing protein [Leptospiraceae bacterium]MBL0264506.1 nucleotidyltransferase domain-containing protein [Leptospiraceae bacterium]
MKNYNPKEDNIVIDFTEELKKQIPSYLKNVALYGSRARGDNKKYSDYDFMVLLKEKNEDVSEIIYDIGYGILDKYEKLASCLIWNEKDWEFHQKFPIGKNILRDGVWML